MLQPLTAKQRAGVQLSKQSHMALYEGSVRSAKTVTSIVDWVDFVRNGPPGNLLMAGKTSRTIKANVIDVMVEWFGDRLCRYTEGSGILTLFGRRIYVYGANNESAADKIRGLTLVGAYCDEVSTMPKSFFTMLTSRLSAPGARLLGTSNPDSSNHWLKTDYLNRARVWLDRAGQISYNDSQAALDMNIARLTFVLDDNPTLSDAYKRQRKAEYEGLLYKRMILGEWCLAEGAVYSSWDPDEHVVDELPAITRWIASGVDYGTNNPSAALMLGLGIDRRLYFTSEWRYDSRSTGIRLSTAKQSKLYRDWLDQVPVPGSQARGVQPEFTVVDSAAAEFIQQLLDDGIASHLADKEVLAGVNLVDSLLSSDRLKVHSSCKGWLAEAPEYVWSDKAAEQGIDEPMKVNDHSMDAGRYATKTTEATWRFQLREAA
jgi:PBSX family phage terminase large subunit